MQCKGKTLFIQQINYLSGTTIDLLLDLVKLASNMSSVAIQDWRVSVADLSGVVENGNLGGKVLSTDSGLVLGV